MNERRVLLIEKVTAVNSGNYRCVVSNKVGRAEKTFNVRVITKPGIILFL